MGELILQLLPLVLGIVLSPLAIMALVAILLSRRPRTNGLAYLIGWGVGISAVLLVGIWLFRTLEVHALREPPLWVSIVRIALGLLLVGAAWWVYRRGQAHADQMAAASTPEDVAAAAPQLPGWLQAVDTFKPGRSGLLGLGVFILNPVDVSCALLAALDIVLADLGTAPTTTISVSFALIGTLPIMLPVLIVMIRGTRAQPLLNAARTWIATHTNVLNAALLLVIGALQLEKGVSALL